MEVHMSEAKGNARSTLFVYRYLASITINFYCTFFFFLSKRHVTSLLQRIEIPSIFHKHFFDVALVSLFKREVILFTKYI